MIGAGVAGLAAIQRLAPLETPAKGGCLGHGDNRAACTRRIFLGLELSQPCFAGLKKLPERISCASTNLPLGKWGHASTGLWVIVLAKCILGARMVLNPWPRQAKNLGCVVRAFDVRPATREQVVAAGGQSELNAWEHMGTFPCWF